MHSMTEISNVSMKIVSGEVKTIQDVLFLHGIVKNLILVGYKADKSLNLEFVYEGCYVWNRNDGRLLVVAPRDAMNVLYTRSN